jgi:hypothetical protein
MQIRVLPFGALDEVNKLQKDGWRLARRFDRREGLDNIRFEPLPDGPHWLLTRPDASDPTG